MEINLERLGELERTIDTLNPEKGIIPIKILGFGEISLVFELAEEGSVAYKRLPIFENETQVKRHELAFNVYKRILEEKIGLVIPSQASAWFKTPTGDITLFCAQEKVFHDSVGNKIIHRVSEQEIHTLILLVMRELKKVWDFNKKSSTLEVGLDGQISNWALIDYDPGNPRVSTGDDLIYLDTSTPMYRKNGVEAMEAVLFLKSAPSFLIWLLKALFLQEVVDRYYDWRLVTIDLIANFYKEQRPDLIPGLIKTVNNFFVNEASDHQIEPFTYGEVHSYYKNDKMIWDIFQSARRMDRFIKTRLFRKDYAFYLPEKIKR